MSPSAAARTAPRAPPPLPPGRPLVLARLALLASLASLASLLPQPAGASSRSYDGWRVLRAEPLTREQMQLLELRVAELGPESAELWRRLPATDILVRPEAMEDLVRFLDTQGIRSRVHVNDLGEEMRMERTPETARSAAGQPDILRSYLRHAQINEFLDDLAVRYPHLVRVITFGESYEGRPMKVIQISSGGGGQRPVILVDAGIHAREWIGPSMALYIIQQLVENPDNAYMLQGVDWHVIPLLNPDGYEHSHNVDRMWRKTRSRTDTPFCWGADPNRNFDYYWGVVGVSWDPCKETFAGSEPFSEPETWALAAYGLSLRNRLRLYVSVHSYGGMFIHPWGYSHVKPTDAPEMAALGKAVAEAVKGAGIPRFEVGNCYETLGEVAAGGSDDWMKAVAGANFSYTLEMPVPSFITPAVDIAKYVVPTFEGFRVLGRFISQRFGCC